MTDSKIKRGFFYLLVISVLLIALTPFLMMLTTALKTNQQSVAYPPVLLPAPLTLQHVKDVLNPKIFPFFRYFGNSLLVSFVSATISVFIGSFAAYSLTRLEFPGKRLLNEGFLIVYMFSGILLVVPLFQIISGLGLYDNRLALILAYLVTTMPAAIYMLRSYFETIPLSLEEAAMIDGLDRFRVILQIVMPLSIPAIMSVFAFVFMISWNDFLFATTLMSSPENMTLTIGLRQLFSSKDYVWGRMMAASLFTAIPVIVMFSMTEKFITGGRMTGGVKE